MTRKAFDDLSLRIGDAENLAAARTVLSRRVYSPVARDRLQAVFRLLNEIDAVLWAEIEELEQRP